MPKNIKFKIGLCQLTVSADKNINIAKARTSIEFASSKGATLVLLPEIWNCPYSIDYFEKCAENFNDKDNSPTYCMLSEVASRKGITIIGGSIPEWSGNKLYNTCCVFGPNGELLAKHRKLHLFDMFDTDVPTLAVFKESDIFSPGVEPTLVDTDFGRIGIGICHDLRFPELAMVYRNRGAHMICYPGAFNLSTGEALWELAQRARAVDNQLYVATCSPSRNSAGSYEIWGHSTLVNPMGEVIVTSGEEEAVVIAEVDYSAIQRLRESIPVGMQKREDLYRFVEFCG